MSIQIVTAGRYNQRTWTKRVGRKVIGGPIFGVKVYEARPRAEDGQLCWRLVEVLPETFTVFNTVAKAAEDYAAKNNLPYLPEVKHGDKLKAIP